MHYNVQIEHVSGKSNDAADALSRMGLETAEAPDESRTFFSTREGRLQKTKQTDSVK